MAFQREHHPKKNMATALVMFVAKAEVWPCPKTGDPIPPKKKPARDPIPKEKKEKQLPARSPGFNPPETKKTQG